MSSGSRQWTFQFFGQNGQLIVIHPAVTPRGKMHNMCCLNSTLSAGGLLGHDRFVSLMFMKFCSLCDTMYISSDSCLIIVNGWGENRKLLLLLTLGQENWDFSIHSKWPFASEYILPTPYSLINIHIRSLQFRQINSSEKFAVASPMA